MALASALHRPARLAARRPTTSRHQQWLFLVLALTELTFATEPDRGAATCQCLDSLAAYNYTGDLLVDIKGVMYDYGSGYGLKSCSAHDFQRPPLCDSTNAPSWCGQLWCWVDATNCTESPQPSAYLEGAYYSYATCGASDSYLDWNSPFAGMVHLCSAFSEKDRTLQEVATSDSKGPCGNTQTHVQVESMVRAINALNEGRGFPVYAGALKPNYLRLTYSWTTYPFGAWESIGRNLSAQEFAKCDLVVGMANGCPDPEIMAQALVANETRRIYVTGRGPRSVLTNGGEYQPYFFSAHLRSDEYAYLALQQMQLKGAKSIAVVCERPNNSNLTPCCNPHPSLLTRVRRR